MRAVYEFNKTESADERRERLINRILWSLIIVLFTVAVLEIVFQFFIAPRMVLQHILVRSDLDLPEERIKDIAGIGKKEYYFSLDIDEVRSRLLEIPQVREAVVEKVFPDTVTIVVKKRDPLAVTLVEGEDKTLPVFIDDEGIVYTAGETLPQWNLPVLSGLEFSGSSSPMNLPGKLPETFAPILAQLAELKETSPDIFNIVSEIKVERNAGGDYELVCYMIPYTTRVRFGSNIDEYLLSYALMVLDVFKTRGIGRDVREIDFRTKEIVYQGQGGIVN
ncbi:MAG: FtsQ-type POTRA domain-containing protein [Spirochaetales bacterium]|nr:FtsQ-type POTRA domain-containing protein [Spirochaetales bacterium]